LSPEGKPYETLRDHLCEHARYLLPIDLLFLGAVGKKLFADNVGDMTLATPRIVPAILFYIIYLAGIVVFVNGAAPSDWMHNHVIDRKQLNDDLGVELTDLHAAKIEAVKFAGAVLKSENADIWNGLLGK
jgi:Predicted membrane protein (DUF2177)